MRSWLVPLVRDRLIRLDWLLALAAVGLFSLVSLAPIDPVEASAGDRTALVGPEQRNAIAAAWGLDRPAHERLLLWAGQPSGGCRSAASGPTPPARGSIKTVATTDSPPLPLSRSARRSSLGLATAAIGLLLAVVATEPLLPGHLLQVDPGTRNLPPGAESLFGTDMLGRGIAAHTLAALSNSIWTGLLAASSTRVAALSWVS